MSRYVQILAFRPLPVVKMLPAGLRSMEITNCESAKKVDTQESVKQYIPQFWCPWSIHCKSAPCASQNRTPQSLDPETTHWPSWDTATLVTQPWFIHGRQSQYQTVNRKCTLWPVKFIIQGLLLSSLFPSDLRFATAPIPLRSQNFSVLSQLPLIRPFPSGVKATL